MKTARSPGKLILSGEHAVLYGAPAIAVAIDRYATATALSQMEGLFSLELLNLSYHKSMTKKALKKIKTQLLQSYEGFMRGEHGIKEVLKLPFELSQFALSHFLEKMTPHENEHGLKLTTHSTIPMGCGMGSSAAMILAVMHAIALAEGKEFDKEYYYQLALETENLQHGRSSGVDIRISLQGGCLYFRQNQYHTLKAPSMPLWIVNTGKPVASTGECVSHTKALFENTKYVDDFSTITNAVSQALARDALADLQNAINENHLLLCKIGVVPTNIQEFIATLKQHGYAAKICGAGSIHGQSAGVVMIIGHEPPEKICQSFDYALESITIDNHGLQ